MAHISEASLVTFLESVPVLLWEADADLRFTRLAGGALRSMGIAPEALAGKPVSDLFGLEGGRAYEHALAGDETGFEAQVQGRELQARVRPLRGAEGAIAGIIGTALDVTERMVAERALRLSDHTYRTLIEEAPYAMCRSTAAGELLQVNGAMTEILGYASASGSELLLRDLPLIFTPPGSFERFQEALLENDTPAVRDCVWTRRDGRPVEVRVSGRAVRDGGGKVSHLDIFAENVTEKKRLEAELHQAQKMQAVGQLAGGVAHDFNNLLTVVRGHVDLLLAQPDDGRARERLGEIRQAVDKAAGLTKQLLAFSRSQVLRSRTINLNEVIEGLLSMLRRLIRENIELRFLPARDLGSVRADPGEIERVLVNLAVNAQEAMPEGGRLTIETGNVRLDDPSEAGAEQSRPGDYIEMAVRDTGVGMDAETQARAFEPFFTTKQSPEGAGLGLAVVYGVVRQTGGHIRLESQPRKGTTFRIYLPRVAASAARKAGAPVPAALSALPGGKETILFAEDNAAIRSMLAHALGVLGYRVLSAPDGREAMNIAHSHQGKIDLLLSDLIMPEVGGSELAALLKRSMPDLKVVFMSGYPGQEAGLEMNGAHFLQKPFSINALANALRSALEGRDPEAALRSPASGPPRE